VSLLLSIQNAGIPIVMSFARVEGLSAIIDNTGRSLRRIQCLAQAPVDFVRHLLAGMKRRKYKYQIGNLIRCQAQKDFDDLNELCFPNLKAAIEADDTELMMGLIKIRPWVGQVSITPRNEESSHSRL
jgi:hypothetical protein